MPNNEIRTAAQTKGQFVVTYQRNGNGGCIPVIDGTPRPDLMFGYVSEADREAGLRLIEEALRSTNGDIQRAKTYMYDAVLTAAKEIPADEAVIVDGEEIIISYENKKAYLGTEEIANCDDMTYELPNEVIKAMLIDRSSIAIQNMVNDIIDELFDDDEE